MKDFSGVIKLNILWWGDFPGLSEGTPYKREERESELLEEAGVMTETEKEVFEDATLLTLKMQEESTSQRM